LPIVKATHSWEESYKLQVVGKNSVQMVVFWMMTLRGTTKEKKCKPKRELCIDTKNNNSYQYDYSISRIVSKGCY